MPAAIPLVLSIGQIGLCLWAGRYSFGAITRLQEYEDVSKKAAKISGTAENELYKTRVTEASGALSVNLLSRLSSLTVANA